MTNEVLQKIASDEQNISSSNGLEPKLRFKEFDGKWSRNILGNCCDIIMGQSPDSSSYNNNCIGLPLVQGNADMCERIATPQRYTSQPTKICEAGSIILSVRAPVGTVGKTFQKICLGRGVCGITSKNIEFMYQYLLNNENSWRHIEQGGTFTAINSDDIKSFPIILPSLPEQKKIADFLSLIDQRIEKQRQLVENLKKYKRGALSRIFNDIEDWEKSEAKDIATIETGCSNTQDNNPNGLYPFYIRSANIARSDKYIFDGEAVLTIGDGQIGKVYHYINGKFDCHQRVYMITKFKKISGRYFYHFFSTFFYNRAIKMSAKNTVDSVRMDMIAQMPIYFPDKEKQEQIVSTLDTIDRFINKQTELLEQMTSLKKGFLQQMFI